MIREALGSAVVQRDPSGSLAVRGRRRYRCAQFALEGVVDARTTPWLVRHLTSSSAVEDVDVLLLSFAGVTHLGAAGLRGLETVADAAQPEDVQVVVCDVPPMIQRVMAAGGLSPAIWVQAPDSSGSLRRVPGGE